MRLRIVACEVLARPLYLAAARSPHVVDVTLLRQGLHDRPGGLRDRLQAELDATSADEYDAVGLAYGLCGGGTAGLVPRRVQVVLPRAHDCITVFLGGRDRYAAAVADHPGTYWYTQDFIERSDGSGIGLGAESDEARAATYAAYVERYGQENADYLMEAMGDWRRHYRRAAFIELGVGDGSAVEARAMADAAANGWTFERLVGDAILVRRLVDGDWADDFLLARPGERIVAAWDEGVVRTEPLEPPPPV